MNLIDAHCHLANLNQLMPVKPLLEEAEKPGIFFWLSSVLTQSEIAWHQNNPDNRIAYSAGIHPCYDECDLELEDIEILCQKKRIWAIGEIGLDRNNPNYECQVELFIAQLELAKQYNLPVVLHLVGHTTEAYKILKQYNLQYLVHGYAGSLQGYKELLRLNTLFTISERLLKKDKKELLLAMIDSKRYLFETDITREYVKVGEKNPLLRLSSLVSSVADLSGIMLEQLITEQQRNFNGYEQSGFFQN